MSEELFASLSTKKTGKSKAADAPETDINETTNVTEDLDLSGSDDDVTDVGGALEDTGDIVIPDTSIVHDETAMLRRQADLMGIKYKEGASADLLEHLINTAMEAQEAEKTAPAASASTKADVGTQLTLREQIYREEMKLIRIRITNMDDKDKNLFGDFFSVCNKFIGDVVKFIPYGTNTEAGYHVPNCIYKQLRDAQYVQFVKTMEAGREVTKTRLVRKFAIEVLPSLTQKEMTELKQRQLATGSLQEDY